MEKIPIQNSFISNAIQTDKTFCEVFKGIKELEKFKKLKAKLNQTNHTTFRRNDQNILCYRKNQEVHLDTPLKINPSKSVKDRVLKAKIKITELENLNNINNYSNRGKITCKCFRNRKENFLTKKDLTSLPNVPYIYNFTQFHRSHNFYFSEKKKSRNLINNKGKKTSRSNTEINNYNFNSFIINNNKNKNIDKVEKTEKTDGTEKVDKNEKFDKNDKIDKMDKICKTSQDYCSKKYKNFLFYSSPKEFIFRNKNSIRNTVFEDFCQNLNIMKNDDNVIKKIYITNPCRNNITFVDGCLSDKCNKKCRDFLNKNFINDLSPFSKVLCLKKQLLLKQGKKENFSYEKKINNFSQYFNKFEIKHFGY